MYEYLVNPTVLLCLAITLVCVSLLYFVLKRSITMLENAQMEQAKVLQSFIERVDMNHVNLMSSHGNTNTYEEIVNNEPLINQNELMNQTNELIDVSEDEEESSDEDESSDGESSDEEESSDDEENGVIDDDEQKDEDAENQEEIDINQMESVEDGIKIVQMDNFEIESLEDVDVSDLKDEDEDEGSKKIVELPSMDHHVENMLDDENESSDDESSDDDSSEDEKNTHEENNIVVNEIKVNKENDMDESVINDGNDNFSEKSDITVNYKTLSVKILRSMAIENGLMSEGEKKNKKELIELLENK